MPQGRVVVFDDDHYYMGSVLAELLVGAGCEVTLVTPAPQIALWSQYTLEQPHILRRLRQLGVRMMPNTEIVSIEAGAVRLHNALHREDEGLLCDGVVLVTNRVSNDGLYRELRGEVGTNLHSLRVIGDAEAPNIIAQAVFSGHLAAQEFEEDVTGDTPNFRRE
jgi:dimethylamine/trimethylamine dehydrogenase